MAGMPRGEPRSVPDPAGEAYDEMIRRERLKRERAEAAAARPTSSVGHPGFAESLIPVWGSGREAVADFQEGDYVGAAANAAMAASDVFLAGAAAKALGKTAFKVAEKTFAKAPARPPSYAWKAVRARMGKDGFAQPGQPVHHWLIPQKGWGAGVPNVIKNRQWNGLPMKDHATHGRLHGRYKGEPQFNLPERYWHGTPTWSKAVTANGLGHSTTGAKARSDERR